MLDFNNGFTYLNLQCPECKFISSEEKPITEEIEVDLDNNTERAVLVCGQCGAGFYK
jgi:phage FluMu protein Com